MNRANWTLAILAVTAFAPAALALSPPSLHIRTYRVGEQVVAATADQKLVGFACHYSPVSGVVSAFTGKAVGTGAMILPNTRGQLDFKNYQGSVRTAYSGAPYKELSGNAFRAICGSTYGDYQLYVGRNGKLNLDQNSVGELSLPKPPQIAPVDLRVVRYGDNVLGVTSDQRIVGIACNKTVANAAANFVFGASAGSGVLVRADENNEVRLTDYQGGEISNRPPAPFDPLSAEAYVALCQGSWGSAHVQLSVQADGKLGLAGSEVRNIESMDEVLVSH